MRRGAGPALSTIQPRTTSGSTQPSALLALKLSYGGPSDPFHIFSLESAHRLDAAATTASIGYQTPHFALLCASRSWPTIVSAALSTAPGGPNNRVTSAKPSRMAANFSRLSLDPDNKDTASEATRTGVKSS